jgi:transcriptional regulator
MREPHFTETELEVGEYRGKGWKCPRIAEWLGISPATVQAHINRAALKIPDMEDIEPMDRVLIYFAHRAWLTKHTPPSLPKVV